MYKKKNPEWLRHLDFELLDLICMELAFVLSYLFRMRGFGEFANSPYPLFCMNLAFCQFLMVAFAQSYRGIIQRGYLKEFFAVFRHYSMTGILFVVITFLEKGTDILSRLIFLGTWVGGMILGWCIRILRKEWVRKRLEARNKTVEIMFLTTPDRIIENLQNLYSKKYTSYHVAGVILRMGIMTPQARGNGSKMPSGAGGHALMTDFTPETGNLELQKELILRIRELTGNPGLPVTFVSDFDIRSLDGKIIDEVYVDGYEDRQKLEKAARDLLDTGAVVHIGIMSIPQELPNAMVTNFGDRITITSTISTAEDWKLALKRLTDICGALVGLLLTCVAGLFIVPAILITDPGPVIFSQKRVGKNGRVFNFYKFRSMYMDAEARKAELMAQNEMSGLMFKMENDPRIIGSEKGPGKGLGNFLRKTSLDELPQFWNILKGDMSLVGTRPPTLSEYEQYEPHHKIRLSMKPGLTGMWQVSGRSDITDFEEVVRLDTDYIENWGIGLDIKILFKTVKVVLGHEGSR